MDSLQYLRTGEKVREKLKSLEEVNRMTEHEVQSCYISKDSKKKVNGLVSKGVPYIQAKHLIIKEDFLKMFTTQLKLKLGSMLPSTSVSHDLGKPCTQINNPNINDSSQLSNHPHCQPNDMSEWTMTKDSTVQVHDGSRARSLRSYEDVMIVQDGYPDVRMTIEQLKSTKNAIMLAVEGIDIDGPQIRFERCLDDSGCLVSCTDKTSAEWLKSVVPQLSPWTGAVLKTLTVPRKIVPRKIVPRIIGRSNIVPRNGGPKCTQYTVFIPDENGERLSAEQILNRLAVHNRGIKVHRWGILANNNKPNGQLWSFVIDNASLVILKQIGMRPDFGLYFVQFHKITRRTVRIQEKRKQKKIDKKIKKIQKKMGKHI